jgi:hypothetical protein
MLPLFNALDRAFDTLAHVVDGHHDPETPRSRPEAALFVAGFLVVFSALFVAGPGSTWSLALWGLALMLILFGLACALLRD